MIRFLINLILAVLFIKKKQPEQVQPILEQPVKEPEEWSVKEVITKMNDTKIDQAINGYKFSDLSKKRLSTCHPKLQLLMNEVIKYTDITIVCGYRDKEAQDRAYKDGRSKLKYPQSKHNSHPSMAVDCIPFPIDWNNIERFKKLAVIVKREAAKLKIEVVHGAVWSFKDWPHWELK